MAWLPITNKKNLRSHQTKQNIMIDKTDKTFHLYLLKRL